MAAHPASAAILTFEQITAYIRKDTHHAVKIELLKNGRKEFSELVEQLLHQWLKSST